MPLLSFHADDDDARAIHAAVARHQSRRIDGEHILPEGTSDTLGAVLGEIARDWLEAHPAIEFHEDDGSPD